MSAEDVRVDIAVVLFPVGNGAAQRDGETAFLIRSRAVAVHMDEWHSVPIPEHHRKGFETLLAPKDG